MGKYMKKTKADGEVAIIDSTLGVRTRGKTLALQRLYSSASAVAQAGTGSYLQLRNRRLAKPTVVHGSPKQLRRALVSGGNCFGSDVQVEEKSEIGINNGDPSIGASFGENVLGIEGRDRGSRELLPCNSIRDIPLAADLDKIFTATEKEQEKSFMDKYNFDPATDKPLMGRFEWEKVDRKE